jgi:signal transduction histidine kinase/PAS domain-containing protein
MTRSLALAGAIKDDPPYRLLFDQFLSGVAFCRMLDGPEPLTDFEFVWVNPAFERMTDLVGVAGRRWSDIVPGPVAGVLEMYGRVCATGIPERIDVYVPQRPRWYEVTAYRISATEFFSVLENITDRKTTEARLLTQARSLEFQESMLRETGHIAKVGGWSLNPETGEGFWTEEVARIHELEPGAAANLELGLGFYIGESRDRIAEAVKAAIAHGTRYDLELELMTRNGTRKWVRTIGHPTVHDGRVTRLHGSIQDITEQKRNERRLATQYAVSRLLAEANSLANCLPELLRTLAQSEGWTFGAVWLVDEAAAVLRCADVWSVQSEAGDRLAEQTRTLTFGAGEGLPGEAWAIGAAGLTFFPEFASAPRYPRAELARLAGYQSGLGIPVTAGGRIVGVIEFLSTTSTPPDQTLGALCEAVGRQVGLFLERRRADDAVRALNAELEDRVAHRTAELESANRELEAFSYSVSHDLRAPLRAVDGFARAMVEDFNDILPPDAREFLSVIQTESQRMGQLIDDLLAFSRLGRLPLTRHEVDMSRLVDEVLDELAPMHGERALAITVQPLPACQGDASLLKQVWLNLIANAFKYSSRTLQARIDIAGGDRAERVVYTVTDNGAGFDARFADKLFGVFQRLHRADEFEGTGVGLAIVRRIVERHGGTVAADGAVGRGATFTFTIPKEILA